jgi:hypothetical protein
MINKYNINIYKSRRNSIRHYHRGGPGAGVVSRIAGGSCGFALSDDVAGFAGRVSGGFCGMMSGGL